MHCGGGHGDENVDRFPHEFARDVLAQRAIAADEDCLDVVVLPFGVTDLLHPLAETGDIRVHAGREPAEEAYLDLFLICRGPRRTCDRKRDETRQQINNIEQAFRALGEEPDDSPCAVTKALDKEAKADIKMADDSVVDTVILSGAAETEHHEIAVYESLIAQAEQLGEPNVVALLQQNLEMEQHTLEEVKKAQLQVLAVVA